MLAKLNKITLKKSIKSEEGLISLVVFLDVFFLSIFPASLV